MMWSPGASGRSFGFPFSRRRPSSKRMEVRHNPDSSARSTAAWGLTPGEPRLDHLHIPETDFRAGLDFPGLTGIGRETSWRAELCGEEPVRSLYSFGARDPSRGQTPA